MIGQEIIVDQVQRTEDEVEDPSSVLSTSACLSASEHENLPDSTAPHRTQT
jgi:hypothetical protein